MISQTLRPTYYYGRRHDYIYYPESWTDTDSGTHYEKGYYDENGKYYDSVAFQKNGRYENVLCHCPYCESSRLLNLNNSAGTTQTLTCPNCGGPMEIVSELDEIVRQPTENTHTYNSAESLKNAFGKPAKKRGSKLILVLILAAFLLFARLTGLFRTETPSQPYAPLVVTESIPDTLCLEKNADGSYHRVTDVLRADRILNYDANEESYRDESSDCWIWYNTDVDPAVWQYWFEGISSDFGDYGWMEHDADGWWIEASAGNWVPLPERYDTGRLWYIG